MWAVAAPALLLTGTAIAHMFATGYFPPHQDPTPAMAEYQRYHEAIGGWICMAASVMWLITALTAVSAAAFWAARMLRTRATR